METHTLVILGISLILSALMPAAILFSKFAVKKRRQATLETLRETFKVVTGTDRSYLPWFEFALQKYDLDMPGTGAWTRRETAFYAFTTVIFALFSTAGMVLLTDSVFVEDTPKQSRILLAGLTLDRAPIAGEGHEANTTDIIAFAFLGGYVWSINYLIRRVTSYDLTPMSFLRTSARMILGCILAIVMWHTYSTFGFSVKTGNSPLLFAFFFGAATIEGYEFISRKLPQLRMKRIDPAAPVAFRSVPIDIIDGIDSQVSFRLAEREIVDVQILAAENPILLCTETPYTLLACIDWIAQAQLVLEVGPKAYHHLRDIGLRTIFALEEAQKDAHLEKLVISILYGDEQEKPESLKFRIASMKANLHVMSLCCLWEIASNVLNQGLNQGPSRDALPRLIDADLRS